jgi:hypothetical protein
MRLHQRLRCSVICALLDRHHPLLGVYLTGCGGVNPSLDLFGELAFALGYSQRLVMVTSINFGDLGIRGRRLLVIRQPFTQRRCLRRANIGDRFMRLLVSAALRARWSCPWS